MLDVLYGGARGGGKTDGLLGEWLAHRATYPGYARGLFVRRSYDELDEVVGRALEMYPPSGGYWNSSKRTWFWPTGDFLRLRYLKRDQDAANYQGHSYTRLYVDEVGNFASSAPIDMLRATLRNKHGVPCALRQSANPGGVGHQWIVDRYIKRHVPNEPFTDQTTGIRRVFVPSRLQDNPALALNDPNYVDNLRASGPAWLVRAWLEGDWTVTPDGGLIKGEWWQRYDDEDPDFFLIVQSWDTAAKEREHNSPSCCTTWGITRHPRYYLLDVFVDRMEYPRLKRAVRLHAQKHDPDLILIEDKSSGTALLQELRDDYGSGPALPVHPIEPVGDKYERAVQASFAIESGQVYLPREADWLLDYEIEMTTFPLAPFKDRVDATSQFLIWAKRNAHRVQFATTAELPKTTPADHYATSSGSDLSGY